MQQSSQGTISAKVQPQSYSHSGKNKRRPQAPFGGSIDRNQAAASALIWADRRLLVRDALFLWMIFLSAMRSRTATDC